jgi:hypothetical protein
MVEEGWREVAGYIGDWGAACLRRPRCLLADTAAGTVRRWQDHDIWEAVAERR